MRAELGEATLETADAHQQRGGQHNACKERHKKTDGTLLFSVKEQGLETKKLRKLLAKEEEEEVKEDVQRDSKVVKDYVENLFVKVESIFLNVNQGLAFIDSSSLVKKTIGRVITFRKI